MASFSVRSEKVEGNFDFLKDFVRNLNLAGIAEAVDDDPPMSPVKAKDINPYTNARYSKRYYELLEERQKLPVTSYKDKFLRLLKTNQVVIVVGDTGSGKTTQIPQWCIEYVNSERGVACTQPRRVTATSVAKRVAEEMDVDLGQQVGYNIRFDSCTSMSTILRYMTDGLLLREAMKDRLLNEYGVILLDETHERALPTDVLMGLLKDAVKQRPELRLIVMSATLNETKFQNYFKDSVILNIPGRIFPVEIDYSNKYEGNYVNSCVNKVMDIHRMEKSKGDILIFLTGQEEIEEACSLLELEASRLPSTYGDLAILPLYANLPPEYQQLVFEPVCQNNGFGINRKVVVATNVAETSLTIDGIAFVVDPGKAKEKVYNQRTRGESLQVTGISQASAKQRAGRAGRTCAGKCYRLYSKAEYDRFPQYTPPVILRSNMGSIVLQLKIMGIKDVVEFDFMDRPEPDAMRQAIAQLQTLGALDEDGDVTELGVLISEFPLDPPVAKMLVASFKYNCSEEILTIASMLSVQQCFNSNKKTRVASNQKKLQFVSPYGDHIMLMNVFDHFKENHSSEKWCKKNYVNYRALKAAEETRSQLAYIISKMDGQFKIPSKHANSYDCTYENVRKVLVIGFFNQVALKSARKFQFTTIAENQAVYLHPSTCINSNMPPECLVYFEYVVTTKDFIRICSPIEYRWVRELAPRNFSARVPLIGSGLGLRNGLFGLL